MFILLKHRNLLLLLTVMAVTFSACSSVNNDVESISEEDLTMAAEVVATSLADDESGLISSMYDAVSTVDNSSITYGNDVAFKSTDPFTNGRGTERNFVHEYDSVTGIHSISFERTVNSGRIDRSFSLDQEIIYPDIDGNFVAQPKEYWDTIESIDFKSTKTGYSDGIYRDHEFTKIDTMLTSGLHSSNSVVTLNGVHRGFGNAEGSLPDSSTTSRDYDIFIKYENVTLNKDTLEANGALENAVSGTLTYSIVMNKTINGEADNTVLEGTIDLETDGTALLKFKGLTQFFRIALSDGELRERPSQRRGN